MKEYYAKRSLSIHATRGVVHLEIDIDDWNEDHNTMMLEFDARELFADIPSLFQMCKKAIKEEDEYNKLRYKELAEDIFKEVKRPVGRPPKD